MNMSALSSITFQQIEIFLTAAKYENFTKAAEELYMTQASVSRNIQSMEIALGIVLFIRHKRRVCLTNAGISLQKDLRQIITRTRKAVNNAYLQQQNQFNRLTIGDFNSTLTDHYLFPIIKDFEDKNPSVDLVLERAEPDILLNNLSAGKYDAAFFVSICLPNILTNGLQGEILFSSPPCIVMSNNHPLYHKDNITIQDVINEPLISMRDGFYSVYWQFAQNVYREIGLNTDNIKFVDNVFTMALELKRGKRISIMDRHFSALNPNEVRYIPLDQCKTTSGVAIVWPEDNTNPYLQKFKSICKAFSHTFDTPSV